MEVAAGEQNVCHKVVIFQIIRNYAELLHSGFPLSKNLHFTLITTINLALFSCRLSVPGQHSGLLSGNHISCVPFLACFPLVYNNLLRNKLAGQMSDVTMQSPTTDTFAKTVFA